MSQTKFRVAICGAGIGGLTLAVVLSAYDSLADVTVYEGASDITTVGAGITIWKRTWTILKSLALDVELAKKAIEPPDDCLRPGLTFRRSDQPAEGYNFYQMINPYGAITLHRADVVDVLAAKIPDKYPIHTSKRLESYSRGSDGSITLHFVDGSTAVTDVLVGADGIHSSTRRGLFRSLAEEDGVTDMAELDLIERQRGPVWTGTLAYRSLIPTEKVESAYPGHQACRTGTAYLGKNKHIVAYPVSQGRLINCVSFYTVIGGKGTTFEGRWVADVPNKEVVDRFNDFEPEARVLTECMDTPSCWAIHTMTPLSRYTNGRVVIIGDAAHAMATHLGAGAGQAIEDAYILGRLLSHRSVTIEKIPDVLKAYESVRLPFANGVVMKSEATGQLYEFNGPAYDGYDRSNEVEELKQLGEQIDKQWEWHWTTDFNEDWQRAEAMLSGALGSRAQ